MSNGPMMRVREPAQTGEDKVEQSWLLRGRGFHNDRLGIDRALSHQQGIGNENHFYSHLANRTKSGGAAQVPRLRIPGKQKRATESGVDAVLDMEASWVVLILLLSWIPGERGQRIVPSASFGKTWLNIRFKETILATIPTNDLRKCSLACQARRIDGCKGFMLSTQCELLGEPLRGFTKDVMGVTVYWLPGHGVGTYPNCRVTSRGREYIGSMAVSETGKACLPWKNQGTILTNEMGSRYTNSFPYYNLAMNNNYCRNPNKTGRDRPWCVVKDATGTSIIEYCNIPYCSDMTIPECRFTTQGSEYIGTRSITDNGAQCSAWNYDPPEFHDDFGGKHNYCRNPDRDSGPLPLWILIFPKTTVAPNTSGDSYRIVPV
ncbi:unnamed protein product [Darwinula stevensoni]|uniref:Kringle domain-containing protein n=1 Tax=Darwinula stevensoni TaxID=69355 RepID=A0A7R8XFF7_9CRUS|nr:unnamed protein product [Darwinula stevensoni]CAG0894981.1 unnamed protein product [Darwinula stevensoni]